MEILSAEADIWNIISYEAGYAYNDGEKNETIIPHYAQKVDTHATREKRAYE